MWKRQFITFDAMVASIGKRSPADIQYLFQQVAHFAFEQELANNEDYLVTEETFMHIESKVMPSLSDEIIAEFEKDSVSYSRV